MESFDTVQFIRNIDKSKLIKAIKKDSEMGLCEANKIASKVIWYLEKEIA